MTQLSLVTQVGDDEANLAASPQKPRDAYLRVLRKAATFKSKEESQQQLIEDTLYILDSFGIPFSELSGRRLEKMALAFLAVANVKHKSEWGSARDVSQTNTNNSGKPIRQSLRTREIIEYINKYFNENIASGSYDDVRRKDLLLPVAAGVIVRTAPDASRNDSTRGYALSTDYAELVRLFDSSRIQEWNAKVKTFLKDKVTLAQSLSTERPMMVVPVKLPSGATIDFSPGGHNELIKAVIEEFLPRYGFGAEVYYVGDAANRMLVYEEEKLQQLKFFDLGHGELPDVVAYSPAKKWLYLIEAVYSSGPISPIRRALLAQLTKETDAAIVFVTAFPNQKIFRDWISDIAWETEVWIADAPDHVVHFDGEKFLGPYEER